MGQSDFQKTAKRKQKSIIGGVAGRATGLNEKVCKDLRTKETEAYDIEVGHSGGDDKNNRGEIKNEESPREELQVSGVRNNSEVRGGPKGRESKKRRRPAGRGR